MEDFPLAPKPHYIPKLFVFFSAIGVAAQTYIAYSQFQQYDLHLITQIKEVVAVIVYSLYALAVWTQRNYWNGGGWPMTLGFIFIVNSLVMYVLKFILDNVFSVENQKKVTKESK